MYKQTDGRKRKRNVICVLDTMWKWKMASTKPFCHPLAWSSDATTVRKSSVRCATCPHIHVTQTQTYTHTHSHRSKWHHKHHHSGIRVLAMFGWLTGWHTLSRFHIVTVHPICAPISLRWKRHSPLIWIFGHSVYKNLLENDYVLLSRCGRR